MLGLPDGYHELGHILLFRDMKRLVHPALAIVDVWYDKALARGKQLDWSQASLDEVDGFRHQWRRSWLLEFGADLIATYLVGPAFGDARTWTANTATGEPTGQGSHRGVVARAVQARRSGAGPACHRLVVPSRFSSPFSRCR